jgi:hypothetical protein
MAFSDLKYKGDSVTCHAAGAIVGARCVAISAAPTGGNPTVNVPAAGAKCFGVAATDVASGNKFTVWHRPGLVLEIEAGAGGVVAGAVVEATATGTVITRAAGIPVGGVVEGAAAGAKALVRWNPDLI